jgi:putative endonuclease
MYFVYLLLCSDGSLYTGITTDVSRRLDEHKNKKGGHYTAAHGANRIVRTEQYATRSIASKREAAIKKLARAKKMELINQ